ncbi:hypothetical protein H1P_1720006 [Hyella patelloides LEGE 07179]|uniref:Uncharacterized protein n=1 Tax=Hyella patelloides LEGE 07179 TaxID=945734 RepID=A0A563VNA0_9CYAN|nr:hypothetical protein H1P_1720006 [Hyella patelloides LEGE 07179]
MTPIFTQLLSIELLCFVYLMLMHISIYSGIILTGFNLSFTYLITPKN